MIVTHRCAGEAGFERHMVEAGDVLPADALWYDLVEPTEGEDRKIEAILDVDVPTREEMRGIEPSSLLSVQDGTLFMAARLLCRSESAAPKLTDVSFILTPRALVTLRYDEPKAFQLFLSRLARPNGCEANPGAILQGLLESIVDRGSEVLRQVGDDVEALSHDVFGARAGAIDDKTGLSGMIRRLGRTGDLISHVRESMLSLERMLLFLQNNAPRTAEVGAVEAQWGAAISDVRALEEHASFLAGKVQFVLDAVLGLVGLEQNKIVKIFSVLAVIFMPPTLIASIYGMNFKQGMWELEWAWGYPFALLLMVGSAVTTYLFFKSRGWL